MADPTKQDPLNNGDAPKKAYQAPELIEYGHLTDLTAAGSQPGMEGGGLGNQTKLP